MPYNATEMPRMIGAMYVLSFPLGSPSGAATGVALTLAGALALSLAACQERGGHEPVVQASTLPTGVAFIEDASLRSELESIVREHVSTFAPPGTGRMYMDIGLDDPTDAVAHVTAVVSGDVSTEFQVRLSRASGAWVVGESFRTLSQFGPATPVEIGADAFSRRGCATCHQDEGDGEYGPTLHGLFGTERTLKDGAVVVANERYIESVLTDPERSTLAGWPDSSSCYRGRVPAREVAGLVEFVRTLD